MLFYTKLYKYFSWLIYFVCICIYIHNSLDFSVMLCDSNISIDNFITDNAANEESNNETPCQYPVSNPGLFLRFRRRVSWYISGKNSGKHASYNDFKNTWENKTSLWYEIKADIKASQDSAAKLRRINNQKNEGIMNAIRDSRAQRNLQQLDRLNKRNNP